MTKDHLHRQPSTEEKERAEKGSKDELPVGVIIVETATSPSTTSITSATTAATAAACEENVSTNIISVSTRACLDINRWQDDSQIPSLENFTQLQHLELDKDRYLTRLHESVTTLKDLQSLVLTRCSRLQGLPHTIGQLSNLQVV
jgi:hypothetical protein